MSVTRAETEEALTESQKSIGRTAECDIVLDDEAVTRKHAVLRPGRSPTVEDLGSRNGTLVGGRAAAMLGTSRRTIVDKIERYGLGRPRRKAES